MSCAYCGGDEYQAQSRHQSLTCAAQPFCNRGQKISEDSKFAARSCSSCPQGEYKSETKHRDEKCTRWTFCGQKEVAVEGTAVSDVKCGGYNNDDGSDVTTALPFGETTTSTTITTTTTSTTSVTTTTSTTIRGITEKQCICPIGLFQPVCGKDGQNYDNRCRAACKKVGIQNEGLCPDACDCSPITKLVCGKDGNTYQNNCQAKCKGTTVQFVGNCAYGDSTSTTTFTSTTFAGRKDTCEYANEGACDEPEFCAVGTDCTDCGDCDEPMPTMTPPPTTTSTKTRTTVTISTESTLATTEPDVANDDDNDECTAVKCAVQCSG